MFEENGNQITLDQQDIWLKSLFFHAKPGLNFCKLWKNSTSSPKWIYTFTQAGQLLDEGEPVQKMSFMTLDNPRDNHCPFGILWNGERLESDIWEFAPKNSNIVSIHHTDDETVLYFAFDDDGGLKLIWEKYSTVMTR